MKTTILFGALRRQNFQSSLDVATVTPRSGFQLFFELHPNMSVFSLYPMMLLGGRSAL